MIMDKVKVISLNVRGMGDAVKKRRVYRYVKLHCADICLLQETHSASNKKTVWSNEWDGKALLRTAHPMQEVQQFL